MIKHSKKYIYSLITIIGLSTLNQIYAKETSDKIMMLSDNKMNGANDSLIVDTGKNKLNLFIKEAESLLLDAKVGTTDGLYPQEAINNFKLVIDESKQVYQSVKSTQSEINAQIEKLKKAIEIFENEEINEYLEHKEKLKSAIQDCINMLSDSTEGSSVGEYSKKTRDTFKTAIANAEKIAAKTDKNSALYINALEVLQKAKTEFESSVISNSELEKYANDLSLQLNNISRTIKEAEVGILNGGVSENQKVALSIMYSQIKSMVKDNNNIDVYKKAIKLANNALSDFNDGTISIDKNNKVNGRKLTGIISKPNSKPTNITMTNKEEFIPQAGIPFDIKLLLKVTGTCFLGLGAIMFRKEPR